MGPYDDEDEYEGRYDSLRGKLRIADICNGIDRLAAAEDEGLASIRSVERVKDLGTLSRSLTGFMRDAIGSENYEIHQAIGKAAVKQAHLRSLEGYKEALTALCIQTSLFQPVTEKDNESLPFTRALESEIRTRAIAAMVKEELEVLVVSPWSSFGLGSGGKFSLSEELYVNYAKDAKPSRAGHTIVRMSSSMLRVLRKEGYKTGECYESQTPITDAELETVRVLYTGSSGDGAYTTLGATLEGARAL